MTASDRLQAASECRAQLELCNVVQEYALGGQPVRALNDITLSIANGEFVSVIGPSGAGKSTMLHLMGALDAPSSGRVLLAGKDLAHLGDNQLADIRRRKVGFVFQFFNLLPMLSAWENVAVPLLLEGVRLRRTKSRAVDLLERVGLGMRVDHRPGELSGGQLQRVAIARALIMDPVVVLADEPTGNLDSDTGTQIVQLLSEIAHDTGSEHAVVMATHSLDAARWADRTLLLVDGAISADSTPEDVLQTFAGSALKVRDGSSQRQPDGNYTDAPEAP